MARRIYGFPHRLYPPLGVSERPAFLSPCGAGQQHVGEVGCVRREQFLEHYELGRIQMGFDLVKVGIGRSRILANDVQHAQSALAGCTDHFRHGEPRHLCEH